MSWKGDVADSFRAEADAYFARAPEPGVKREVEVVYGSRPYVAKRFPGVAPLAFVKARKEYRLGRALKAAGIPVPEPLGAAHDRRGAVYFCGFVEGVTTFREAVETGRWSHGEWVGMMRGLGAFVRRVHDAKFLHGDLHVGNLLWKPGAFWVIDLHEGFLDKASPEEGDRLAEMGFLLLSLQRFASTADFRRIVEAYWPDWPARGRFASAMEALAKARHAYYRDRARRAMDTGSRFERTGIGVRIRGVEAPVKREGEVVKEVGRRRLVRVGGALFKTYERGAVRGLLEFMLAVGAGEREWRNLEAFRVRDLPTPSAVAYEGGLLRETVVMEWIEGARPLWEYVKSKYVAWSKGERDAFLQRLAALVRRMHDEGIAHGDLKANNVLVSDAGMWFVDLDRVRVRLRIDPETAMRNLAELNAAVGAPVTRWDRLRFLRAYAGRRTYWNRHFHEAARRVYERTVRRRHVWPPRTD